MTLPFAPHYGAGGLDAVLPAVAATLGSRAYARRCAGLDPARRAVVVLVDGLGDVLLQGRAGHAPFLRTLVSSGRRLTAGFPSTTATSMGTFGTGTPPGTHGLLGYEVLIPGADRLLNELSWEDGPDPLAWQIVPTVLETLVREGVAVTRTGPAFFDGSGLTNAALRGGRFVAARTFDNRVDAAVAAVGGAPRALAYVYWGDLDKVGHVHGVSSRQWVEELESVDRAIARLVASVPADTAVHITADHGMVDVPASARVDLADEPDLARGIRHLGGEMRAPQLYCEPGAAPDVLAAWTERLAARAWVRSREEAVAAGWFGTVTDVNLARIGDVVVAMRESYAVVDRHRTRPELLALLGQHGSLTDAETAVPWLIVPPEPRAPRRAT